MRDYTTQPGTIAHRAMEHLKALSAGTELSSVELADALGLEGSAAINNCLRAPEHHGLVRSRKVYRNSAHILVWKLSGGVEPLADKEPPLGRTATALRDAPKPPATVRVPTPTSTPAPRFRAAMFSDGTMTVRKDGVEITLDTQEATELKWLARGLR